MSNNDWVQEGTPREPEWAAEVDEYGVPVEPAEWDDYSAEQAVPVPTPAAAPSEEYSEEIATAETAPEPADVSAGEDVPVAAEGVALGGDDHVREGDDYAAPTSDEFVAPADAEYVADEGETYVGDDIARDEAHLEAERDRPVDPFGERDEVGYVPAADDTVADAPLDERAEVGDVVVDDEYGNLDPSADQDRIEEIAEAVPVFGHADIDETHDGVDAVDEPVQDEFEVAEPVVYPPDGFSDADSDATSVRPAYVDDAVADDAPVYSDALDADADDHVRSDLDGAADAPVHTDAGVEDSASVAAFGRPVDEPVLAPEPELEATQAHAPLSAAAVAGAPGTSGAGMSAGVGAAAGAAAMAGLYRNDQDAQHTQVLERPTVADEQAEEERLAAQLRQEREARDQRLGRVATSDANAVREPAPRRRGVGGFGSFGLFILRIVTAAILGVLAYQVLGNIDRTAEFLGQTLIPEPRLVSWILGFALGAMAIFLVIGLAVRVVGLLLAVIAGGALAFIRWGAFSPFVEGLEGFVGDKDLLLAAVGLLFFTLGGGRAGIDGAISTARHNSREARNL